MNLLVVLSLVDLILTAAAAAGKVPLWAPVFAVCVTLLVAFWGR